VSGSPPGAGRSLGAVREEVEERLRRAGVPTPQVDAELLLAHVTGRPRTQLRLGAQALVEPAVLEALEPLVVRRVSREPLQLIVGSVGFRYLEIEVRPGVFIPRPETETLAGEAIARLPPGGVVVEPCTGTGAVACAVASEVGGTRVVATDLSEDACALARVNAARSGVAIDVRRGDLLDPVPTDLRGMVEVVVSNPPYVAADELDDLEPEVVAWDPHRALVSGPTGHEVSDRLIAEAGQWLRPWGWLLMEVDAARAQEAAARCAAAGYVEAGVIADLTGRDRIVVARWAPTDPTGVTGR
jgi:release factor glutamine methyltransferase